MFNLILYYFFAKIKSAAEPFLDSLPDFTGCAESPAGAPPCAAAGWELSGGVPFGREQ